MKLCEKVERAQAWLARAQRNLDHPPVVSIYKKGAVPPRDWAKEVAGARADFNKLEAKRHAEKIYLDCQVFARQLAFATNTMKYT